MTDPSRTLDLPTRIRALRCWSGPIDPRPLKGGITNANFLVEDKGHDRHAIRAAAYWKRGTSHHHEHLE